MPPAEAFHKLVAWLRSIGVAAVFDLCTARDLALLETAAEFVDRCALAGPGAKRQLRSASACSQAR